MRSCTLRPDGSYELSHDGTDEVLVVSAEELEAAAAAFFPPEAPPVPAEITMRQARLVLLGAGLLHQVDAALNALPSPMKEAAFIEWEYSSTVKRSSTLVVQLGQSFGLTGDQIDAMFRQGATL